MRNYKIIQSKRLKRNYTLGLLSLFLIFIISLSSLSLLFGFQDNLHNLKGEMNEDDKQNNLLSSDLSFFYSPFNYTKINDFFISNYISDFDFDVNTYKKIIYLSIIKRGVKKRQV
jgi:hypothetical protein